MFICHRVLLPWGALGRGAVLGLRHGVGGVTRGQDGDLVSVGRAGVGAGHLGQANTR